LQAGKLQGTAQFSLTLQKRSKYHQLRQSF